MSCLLDALERAYRVLGFDQAEADRGRGPVAHPRREDPLRRVPGRAVAPRAPRAGHPDGHLFTQPWPAGPNGGRRDQVIYYQYRHDRARRTLRGTGEQVARAEQAVAGKTPVKRNRFVRLSGGTRTINRELEGKARALAGLPRRHAGHRAVS